MKEKEVLEIFNEKTEILKNFLRAGESKRSVSIGSTGKTLKGPQEDQVHSAVLTLRLFMQDNEVISLSNVSKTYASIDIFERSKFEVIRQSLNTYLDSPSSLAKSSFNYSLETVEKSSKQVFLELINASREDFYSNRDILYIFMYGEYAHLKQREKYRKILDQYDQVAIFYFWSVVDTFIHHLIQIQQVNKKALVHL